MKTKKQKKVSSGEIKEKLSRSKITVFTSFAQNGQKGLGVKELRELRKTLRPLEGEFLVEKKTVINKALKSNKMESDVLSFEGSLGIAYGYDDPFAVARALYQFSKTNPAFKLYGAFMGADILDQAKIMELGSLPTKEVLLGRLVGMLSYPMRGLVVALNQISVKKAV